MARRLHEGSDMLVPVAGACATCGFTDTWAQARAACSACMHLSLACIAQAEA